MDTESFDNEFCVYDPTGSNDKQFVKNFMRAKNRLKPTYFIDKYEEVGYDEFKIVKVPVYVTAGSFPRNAATGRLYDNNCKYGVGLFKVMDTTRPLNQEVDVLYYDSRADWEYHMHANRTTNDHQWDDEWADYAANRRD